MGAMGETGKRTSLQADEFITFILSTTAGSRLATRTGYRTRKEKQ